MDALSNLHPVFQQLLEPLPLDAQPSPLARSCKRCGREFVLAKTDSRPNKGQFCSKACASRSPLTPADRVLARCVPVGDCLVFGGCVGSDGYGHITIDGKTLKTHRVVYEAVRGPIPAGLTIDHVRSRGCKFKTCCNVNHLEVVTLAENIRRAHVKTHCLRGHELTGANLEQYALTHGIRKCVACRDMRFRQRRKAVRHEC